MENPPSGAVFSAAGVAKADELFVTAICKNARLENTALGMKRKVLRDNITVLQEKFKQVEDNYWRQYHVRLDGTNKGTSTVQWVSNFATKEGAVVKKTKQKLDELRRQIHGLEVQLRAAEDEFWTRWQDYMTKLAHVPQLTSTPPEASHATCTPVNVQDVKDTMPPPSRPRRSSKLPAPVHPQPAKKVINAKKKILHRQAGPRRPVPKPETALLSNPKSSATASPLARPAFFPHGPPPEKPATDAIDTRRPDTPVVVVVPESSSTRSKKASNKPITATDQALPPQAANRTASSEALQNVTENNTPFQGITDPKVGHIYKAYYKHDDHEGWWMCTVLPTLPAHESGAWAQQVGISFPSMNLDLWYSAPTKCYSLETQAKRKAAGKWTKKHHVITGWQPGYGDGQPLVTQRVFPVLFFEDRKGVHGHFDVPMPPKNFNFKTHAWDWVEAKDLRPVDADVGPVYGSISADKFMKRLEALRKEGRDKNSSRVSNHTSAATIAAAPVQAAAADDVDDDGRPAKRRRIKIIFRSRPLSTQPQPDFIRDKEGQEDSEMADAGSLSGDTVAASSTSQSDDELSKPLRV